MAKPLSTGQYWRLSNAYADAAALLQSGGDLDQVFALLKERHAMRLKNTGYTGNRLSCAGISVISTYASASTLMQNWLNKAADRLASEAPLHG